MFSRSFNRALFLGAVAVVGVMSMCPVQAEESKPLVATAIPGLPINSDPAFQKAVDFIRESNIAREKQKRHENLKSKPVIEEKVVRARDVNHVMIMGIDGSAALPM